MSSQILHLVAQAGDNVLTFKETGYANDNTGTYLANISLTDAASEPVLHANAHENGVQTFDFVPGVDFSFGADGAGSAVFDIAHAVISAPAGLDLQLPTLTYDATSHQITMDPGTAFDALGAGEIATLTVPFTVTDADGDVESGTYQFTITGTNDAPVITTGDQAATIVEPGDLALIYEAGPNNPSDGNRPGLEPTVHANEVDSLLDNAITAAMSVSDMNTTLDAVKAALGAGATQGDAIAAVWNYLDTRYFYTNDIVNEAQAKLAIVYAQYLKSPGSMALLDVVAKYTPDGTDTGDTPDRLQSLHDNILGNLGQIGLADKLGNGSAAYLRIETAADEAGLSGVFHDRPIYSGNEGAANQSLAWDISNGLYPAASGTMAASDIDNGDTLIWSDVTGSAGTYGTFALDAASGKWTYVLDPGAADSLAAGDSRVETFTVQVSDGHGGIDTATVNITITGSNDAPVIIGSTSQSHAASGLTGFVEADDAAGGYKFAAEHNLDTLIASQIASGMDMAHVLGQVQTALGSTATLAQAIAEVWGYINDLYTDPTPISGYYKTVLNEASARLGVEYANYLKDGGTPLLDVVAQYKPDGADLGDTPDRMQSLHDNLLGNLDGPSLIDKLLDSTSGGSNNTNPDPVAYQAILDLLAQNGLSDLTTRPIYDGRENSTNLALAWDQAHGFAPAEAGQMHTSDVDDGAVLTWSGSASGTYGSLAIDAETGEWTYTVDPTKTAFAELAQGHTASETFTVTVTDEHDAKDHYTLTVTATGANDAPMIDNGGATGSVVERGGIADVIDAFLTGNLEPSQALADTVSGYLAGLENDGSKLESVYASVLSDVHGNAAQAIAIVWDYIDDFYGLVGSNKVEVNEAFTRLGVIYAQYLKDGGTPLLDVVAKYAPDANNDGVPQRFQSLHDNLLGNVNDYALTQRYVNENNVPELHETLKDLIEGVDPNLLNRPSYSGNEGTPDAATRAWDSANGYDGASHTGGQLTATDADQGDTWTWSVDDGAGTYGTFSIEAATGKWTYVLDDARSATQALAEGQTETETFKVIVTDAHGATDTVDVVVNIAGSNDAPVITGSTFESHPASGLTGFVEADAASNHNFEPEHELGSLQQIINDHKTDMDAVLDAVQAALGGADRATAIAHVWDNLDDHYTSTGYYNTDVNILFIRLGLEYVKYLQDGGTPLLDAVVKYEADTNGNHIPQRDQSMHDNLLGNFDAVTLSDRFGADPALLAEMQNLIRDGDPVLLTRPAYDGRESSTNQALAWDQAHGFVPMQAGQMHASDVDDGAVLTWSGSASGTYGSLAIDAATGEWTYTVDPTKAAFAELAQGHTASETFTVTVTDEHGAKSQSTLTVAATGIYNVWIGTSNHDNDNPSYAEALSVPEYKPADINEPWAIFGRGGDDILTGGNADDILVGEGGNDVMNGGKGNDAFLVTASIPANGFDSFNGGDGYDRILSTGNGIDIQAGAISGIEEISSNGYSNIDLVLANVTGATLDLTDVKLRGIAEVRGTEQSTGNANQVFYTSNDSDAADGQAYRGGGGNDIFHLGSQSTRLLISQADNGGVDSFTGNKFGDAAIHTIVAESDGTQIGLSTNYGGTGSVDVIDASGATNTSLVGSSSAHNNWDLSTTVLKGISVVDVAGGDDTVRTAVYTDGPITYKGGNGNDTLVISLTAAQASNPAVLLAIASLIPGPGDNGSVSIDGLNFSAVGFENFKIGIAAGDTYLPIDTSALHWADANHNTMSAPDPTHAAALFAQGGNDTITGGNADDILVGGKGMDAMDGGNGSDTYLVGPGDGPAPYGDAFTDSGSTGTDRIIATGDDTQIVIKALSGIEEINGGGFHGVNVAGATGLHNVIDLSHTKLVGIGEVQGGGATSNDTFYTSNDSDAVDGQAYRGGAGNDTFYLGNEDTRILASSADVTGFDTYKNNTDAAKHVIIAEDDGTRVGLSGIYGGTNSVDEITANGHHDVTIVGGVVHNNWDFTDTTLTGIAAIYGGDSTSNDTIVGSAANDTIYGLGGQDRLSGGAANDTLTGGAGVDTFGFKESGAANADIITDFNVGGENDVLDLSYLLDSISTDKASHVRFLYSDAGNSTHVLSDGSAAPAVDGDVTVQVNTSGSWENVVTLTDNGGNLTTGSNVIQMMLDHATVQQFHA